MGCLLWGLWRKLTWFIFCCGLGPANWPKSQIPQCTSPISHNVPFRTEMCTFLFWMVHCAIWDRCIVGFVRLVYFTHILQDDSTCTKTIILLPLSQWSNSKGIYVRLNESWESKRIDNHSITKQSTTKPCAYSMGYTLYIYMFSVIDYQSFIKNNDFKEFHKCRHSKQLVVNQRGTRTDP